MREWITPELILGVTLLTTFTLVGIVILWAAKSMRPWPLRVAAILAMFGSLLLVPAHEPLLAIAVQSGVIVAGVLVWGKRHRRIRFSMRTLLLVLTPAAAAFAAVAARVASQGHETWTTVNVIGMASGSAVLIGAWMGSTRRPLVVWPIAIVLSTAIGLLVFWQDWFAYATLWAGGWPPTSPYWRIRGVTRDQLHTLGGIWVGVMGGITLLSCTCTLLVRRCSTSKQNRTAASSLQTESVQPDRWAVGQKFLVAYVFLVAAWPAYLYWQLTHPEPLPYVAPVSSNGLDDIVAAATQLSESPILGTELAVQPATATLQAEIVKYAAAYAKLKEGFSKPIRIQQLVPPNKARRLSDAAQTNLRHFHVAGNGLSWAAELARREGRIDDVVQHSLQLLDLSAELKNGGAKTRSIMAMILEGMAVNSLYPARNELDAATCRHLLDVLGNIDRGRESHEEMIDRDWVWEEHTGGWSAGLQKILKYDFIPNAAEHFGNVEVNRHYSALTRLLLCELAVRAYRVEQGAPPDQLSQLVPEFLDVVPTDPHDPAGGPLRYLRTATGYVIYSIGLDGRDDGGISPKSGTASTGWDLRLEDQMPTEDGTPANSNAMDGPATPRDEEPAAGQSGNVEKSQQK